MKNISQTRYYDQYKQSRTNKLVLINVVFSVLEPSKRKYSSIIDVIIKTVRAEGITSLYKGFFPVWMRIAPHTIVTFAAFEQLRKLAGISPI